METIEQVLAQIRAIVEEGKTSARWQFTREQKAYIVYAHIAKGLSLSLLSREFGVAYLTMFNWFHKFADEINTPPHPGASHPGASAAVIAADAPSTSKYKTISKSSLPMAKETKKNKPISEDEMKRLLAENELLKEKLRIAHLKLHVSDLMIDEAEKTFNIQIRKKSATK